MMIKYVLVLLWFEVGAFREVHPVGQAWINHFDTMEECMSALSEIPVPQNPRIEWYALQCDEFTFNNAKGTPANDPRTLPNDFF